MSDTADIRASAGDDAAGVPQTADALLSKYKAAVKKLRAMVDAKDAELAAAVSRVSELEVAARASASRSVLSALLLGAAESDAGGLESARVIARAVVGDAERVAWVCLAVDGGLSEWVLEDDVVTRVPRFAAAVRAVEPHASPADAAALRARADGPSEELRKFRVRTEALLRAKDAELGAARDRADAAEAARREAGAAAGEDGGELISELRRRTADALSAAERATRARADALERERAAIDAAEDAAREAAIARDEATLWQTRWAEASGATVEGSGAGATTTAASDDGALRASMTTVAAAPRAASPTTLSAAVVAAESAAAATALELTKLTQEYTAYRRRAVALMKERDESLRKLSDDLAAARAKAKAAAGGGGACDGDGACDTRLSYPGRDDDGSSPLLPRGHTRRSAMGILARSAHKVSGHFRHGRRRRGHARVS